MKRIILITVICLPTLLIAQSSLYRSQSPFSAKIGLEGIGLDVTIGNRLGFDVTSFLVYHSFKARVYILEKNGSPFIGLGVGKYNGGFGGGQENQWTVVLAGWEHDYEVFLIQLMVQQPIYKKYDYAYSPFIFNINLGMRIH
jgi:hypothetical protein